MIADIKERRPRGAPEWPVTNVRTSARFVVVDSDLSAAWSGTVRRNTRSSAHAATVGSDSSKTNTTGADFFGLRPAGWGANCSISWRRIDALNAANLCRGVNHSLVVQTAEQLACIDGEDFTPVWRYS